MLQGRHCFTKAVKAEERLQLRALNPVLTLKAFPFLPVLSGKAWFARLFLASSEHSSVVEDTHRAVVVVRVVIGVNICSRDTHICDEEYDAHC